MYADGPYYGARLIQPFFGGAIMATSNLFSTKRLVHVLMFLAVLGLCAQAFAAPAEPNKAADLFEMSIEQLMDIEVVSASRQAQKIGELSVPVSVISADDIHYSGLTTIPEILQFYPGMDVLRVDRNRYSVGIRGWHDVHSEHMQTLIDGRTADSAVFGGPEWFRFPIFLEDIKQIEIVRGPAGAAWGANALTGTVNIITKEPEETQGWLTSTHLNHFGDSYNYARWGSRADKWIWRFSLGYGEHETAEDAIDDDNFLSRDFSRDGRFDSKAVYQQSEKTKWSMGLGYSNNETGDYEFSGLFRQQDSRFEYTRAFVKVDHEFEDGSTGYLQWFLNYDKSHDQAIVREWVGIENDIEGQYNFAPSGNHEVSVGGHFRWTHVNTHSADAQDFAFPGEPFDMESAGAFITDHWDVTDRLALESQIRAEWYSETKVDWAGRLAALYALDEKKDHIFRVAGARAFRTPQVGFEEFSLTRIPHPVVPGAFISNVNTLRDDDLKNEETWSIEAGYTGRLSDTLTLKTNTYYQRFDNLIQTFPLSDPLSLGRNFQYLTNHKGADTWGNEIELEKATQRSKIAVWYAYNGFQEEAKGTILRSYPPARHKAGVRSRFLLDDGWALNANYRYTTTTDYDQTGVPAGSGLPRNAANNSHRFDVSMTKEFNKGRGEVMFGVLDLFNKEAGIMQDRGTLAPHDTPGRTFFASLLWRF